MMGPSFLSVRTSGGDDMMVSVKHLMAVTPCGRSEQMLSLWLSDGDAYEVVGTMDDMRFALATLGVSIMPLHDFTSENVKEG